MTKEKRLEYLRAMKNSIDSRTVAIEVDLAYQERFEIPKVKGKKMKKSDKNVLLKSTENQIYVMKDQLEINNTISNVIIEEMIKQLEEEKEFVEGEVTKL